MKALPSNNITTKKQKNHFALTQAKDDDDIDNIYPDPQPVKTEVFSIKRDGSTIKRTNEDGTPFL